MVLMVLTDLVVFVGGIFERVKSPNFLWGEIIESQKKKWRKRSKNPKDDIKNPPLL